ncbi:helix-turn-helix domain-containing protein [Aerophototrophica crusticola]|uniref:Helix-turn-helix domain-containing protein n=1 Tax=Aerophototrophica crusticola TaxID=1709002 RepID=A0A858R8D0_9PROT|nr:helix-turn-helix domain-containing protein [Rhodospirillaceae bacterium B3]
MAKAVGADRHHYLESGLDYVWLSTGFTREETAHGPAVMVENATALDRAIALVIIRRRRHLTGQEVRFLRGLMDMTQEELGTLLGKDAQSVARWEKSKTSIPPTEDRALRQIFLEHVGERQPFTETARQVSAIRDDVGALIATGTGKGQWAVTEA